jgi:dTDP-4-amino-4,6-dideoxygalactose transaminase
MIPHSKPLIDQEDIAAVSEVLASGNIAQGVKVNEFEQAVSKFVGAKFGVACSSGTSALHLALISIGVGPGDEVIMPSYVCSSPYFAALHAGAVPKLADINFLDFNISVESIREQLSEKTKAIIVPHMFGAPAEIDELLALGVPIVEDCAQSLGAQYKGQQVGSFGTVSAFSFYATKMITTGEGGMVLTNEPEFYSKLFKCRDYDKKSLSSTKYNYKMTDFQAALGLSQLKKLRHFIERRRQIAYTYDMSFSDCNIELPLDNPSKKSVYFRYVIKVSNRDWVQQEAKNSGLICEKPVFRSLHTYLGLQGYPNSDRATEKSLSIPIYPSLTNDEIEKITQTLRRLLPQKRK